VLLYVSGGSTKNNYQLVSRILFQSYHLSALRIAAEMLLPTRKLRRAAFERLPMWHYSMQGLPAIIVANNCRELLPHVFNLTPPFPKVERERQ
jgi:hypothetical protein